MLKNAPENNQLTSPPIQEDICSAVACLTTKAIVEGMKDELFSLLVDEVRDVSTKEQMPLLYAMWINKGVLWTGFLALFMLLILLLDH